jgi:hypothetical protein
VDQTVQKGIADESARRTKEDVQSSIINYFLGCATVLICGICSSGSWTRDDGYRTDDGTCLTGVIASSLSNTFARHR